MQKKTEPMEASVVTSARINKKRDITVAYVILWGTLITAIATVFTALVTAIVKPEWFSLLILEQEATLTPVASIIEIKSTVTPPSVAGETSGVEFPTSVWAPPLDLPGADWAKGCINSEIWQIYSSENDFNAPTQDGCYQLLEYGISAHQGNLAFVREKVRVPEAYGILVPIPDNAAISFTLRATKLEKAEVWVGIAKEPTSWSGIYLVSKDGGNFAIREVTNNIPARKSRKYHDVEEPYRSEFQFEIEGNQWDISYDNSPAKMFSNVNLDFSPRYLFLGYRVYSENGVTGCLDTRISDLIIEKR